MTWVLKLGICYLGKGRIALSWWSKPADINFNECYNRLRGTIWHGKENPKSILRAAMVDCYTVLPAEKLAGGSFVKISDDYGLTWGEAVRLPVNNVLGVTKLSDGTLLFFGKGFFDHKRTVQMLTALRRKENAFFLQHVIDPRKYLCGGFGRGICSDF